MPAACRHPTDSPSLLAAQAAMTGLRLSSENLVEDIGSFELDFQLKSVESPGQSSQYLLAKFHLTFTALSWLEGSPLTAIRH